MRSKKTLSDIITVPLFIIIVIILIFILWLFVKGFVKKQGEVAEIKTELLNMNVDIHYANISSDVLEIVVSRGAGKLIIKNITRIEKKADIVFAIDSTGSMSDEIADVNATVRQFADRLANETIDYLLGLVEFKDYPEKPCGISDDFPSKTYLFSGDYFSGDVYLTKDISRYKNAIASIIASGGDDTPEAVLTALESAANLPYREEAYKFIIVLTDAPPHAAECNFSNKFTSYRFSTLNDFSGNNLTCYKGPALAQSITDLLVSKGIVLYYINKNEGMCDNRIMENQMTPATGGKFFNYSETGGVQEIFLQLAAEINIEYEKEKYDHLKIIVYNATSSCEKKVPYPPDYVPPPLPLETKTYNITLGECIKNATRIEVYPVIISSAGEQVTGQKLDSIVLQ